MLLDDSWRTRLDLAWGQQLNSLRVAESKGGGMGRGTQGQQRERCSNLANFNFQDNLLRSMRQM